MKFRKGAAGLWVVLVAVLVCLAALQASAQKKPPARPLDLNTATEAQLEQLPGVGPVTAQSIIRFRQKSGPFQRVEDLLAIRGISQKKLAKIRPYVRVALPSRKKAKIATTH